MGLTITPIITEPIVSVDEMKIHQGIDDDFTDHDEMIRLNVLSASEWVEGFVGRQLLQSTIIYYIDRFPLSKIMLLPRPPLQSVTSIKYDDTEGAEQTLNSSLYRVDTFSEPGRIQILDIWPDTFDHLNAVRIEYVAGYADGRSVPEKLRFPIKMLASENYERREQMIEESSLKENKNFLRLLYISRIVSV